VSKYWHPRGATYYVLPNGQSPMVKEADFFVEERGHQEAWGEAWIPVVADGLHHARLLGYFIGSGARFPDGIAFEPPNTQTVGRIKQDGFDWDPR
jgi:hypothetical protein